MPNPNWLDALQAQGEQPFQNLRSVLQAEARRQAERRPIPSEVVVPLLAAGMELDTARMLIATVRLLMDAVGRDHLQACENTMFYDRETGSDRHALASSLTNCDREALPDAECCSPCYRRRVLARVERGEVPNA